MDVPEGCRLSVVKSLMWLVVDGVGFVSLALLTVLTAVELEKDVPSVV